MKDAECLVVTGEPSSALLCRLLGLLAQLDLPAPQMTVTLRGNHMTVEMHFAPFGDQALVILAHKAARLIGIDDVCLNGRTI